MKKIVRVFKILLGVVLAAPAGLLLLGVAIVCAVGEDFFQTSLDVVVFSFFVIVFVCGICILISALHSGKSKTNSNATASAGKRYRSVQTSPARYPLTHDHWTENSVDAYRRNKTARQHWQENYRFFEKCSDLNIRDFPKTFQTFQKHKEANSEQYLAWMQEYNAKIDLKNTDLEGEDTKATQDNVIGTTAVSPTMPLEMHRVQNTEHSTSPPRAALTYLDAEALRFWNGRRTDFIVPQYYNSSEFGRNVKPALSRLLEGGYLSLGGVEERIALQKVPELKAVLAEHELKVSGTKKELVARLINYLEPDEIEELFPVNVYRITAKGQKALAPYSILKENSAHALGFSTYRLMEEREAHPDEPDDVTLARLLADDLRACVQRQDRSSYQDLMMRFARFMQETGESKIAVECYILSFFMWTKDMEQLNVSPIGPEGYFLAKNIEESAQLCGYDFTTLLHVFRETLYRENPFSMASKASVEKSIQIFKQSLGIKGKRGEGL